MKEKRPATRSKPSAGTSRGRKSPVTETKESGRADPASPHEWKAWQSGGVYVWPFATHGHDDNGFSLLLTIILIQAIEHRSHAVQQRLIVSLNGSCTGHDRRKPGRFGDRDAAHVQIMDERAQSRQR
jgi:hypothetical protein